MLKHLVCCLAMLVAGTAHADAIPPHSDFRAIIPHNWRLDPQFQGSTVAKFISPAGDAWLALFARPVHQSLTSQLAQLRAVRDGQITYQREGRTWIVVSGFKGNRIFYRKAILACSGEAWHYLEFEYPATEKRAFDRFVTRSSAALGAYSKSGCRG